METNRRYIGDTAVTGTEHRDGNVEIQLKQNSDTTETLQGHSGDTTSKSNRDDRLQDIMAQMVHSDVESV